MRVTPADIRQQSFTVRFRGFDPQEVDACLEDVAEDLEATLKENALLKEQLVAMEERTRGLAEREKLLQETLVTTHRLAEDMREAARREIEQHLKESERQREAILEAARGEEARIRDDVQALKRTRQQLMEELRATIDTAQRWIAELDGETETRRRSARGLRPAPPFGCGCSPVRRARGSTAGRPAPGACACRRRPWMGTPTAP